MGRIMVGVKACTGQPDLTLIILQCKLIEWPVQDILSCLAAAHVFGRRCFIEQGCCCHFGTLGSIFKTDKQVNSSHSFSGLKTRVY